MVTQTIPKQSNRDQYIQQLKEFIPGNDPLSVLVDALLMEEFGATVSTLSFDEETEKEIGKFAEHSDNIEAVIKDLADPISDSIQRELNRMNDCMRSAVYQSSRSMFDLLSEFFVVGTLVPFLKDLTARLEARGGAA